MKPLTKAEQLEVDELKLRPDFMKLSLSLRQEDLLNRDYYFKLKSIKLRPRHNK